MTPETEENRKAAELTTAAFETEGTEEEQQFKTPDSEPSDSAA